MENVSIVLYCNGDMIPSFEGILFECPRDPKIIIISENMSLDALRKIIIDSIRGCKILLDLFYYELVYVGDGCFEYKSMELKCDDVGKMFFILSELVAKVQLS